VTRFSTVRKLGWMRIECRDCRALLHDGPPLTDETTQQIQDRHECGRGE
jgi:hypothetical protein